MLFFRKKAAVEVPDDVYCRWIRNEHTVRVEALDQDHREMADLLCQVHEAIIQGRDRAKATSLLEALIQRTRLHFAQEEVILRQAAYPELEPHAEEHALLLEQATDLLRRFKAGTISGLALPAFVKHWFLGHVSDADRKYAAHLRRSGVQ